MLKFTCLCFAAALPLPCLCFAVALLGFLTALNCFANFQYAATLPLLCHYFAIFGKEPLLPLSNTSSKTHQKTDYPPSGGMTLPHHRSPSFSSSSRASSSHSVLFDVFNLSCIALSTKFSLFRHKYIFVLRETNSDYLYLSRRYPSWSI
jgi:hypothetical protein